MKNIDRIAIFGANGMLGRYVAHIFKDLNPILYTRKEFDIEKDKVRDLPSFDLIINCAGVIKQREDKRYLLYRTNSLFPRQLSERYDLIQISTDCVFSGNHGMYFNYDVPDPVDDYGISKYLGECGMVIRTSVIGYGNPLGLLEWVLSQQKIKGYTDHYWNGVTCLQLAKFLLDIVVNREYKEGVIHYTGEVVNKYLLCWGIAEANNHHVNITQHRVGKIDRTLIGENCNIPLKYQLHEMADCHIR